MRVAKNIRVEIAPGELIDKITILEIKVACIRDTQKIKNVRHELETLSEARDMAIADSPEMRHLTGQLKEVNESLWGIEDRIRRCEREQDFGSGFIELARSVYRTNDKRAAIKRQINELLGSQLIEEKEYVHYEP